MAVGHVRYSTTGANSWENSQPVWRADRRELALGHNGNLINAVELHTELREAGVTFRSTSDSEIIAALLSTHRGRRSSRTPSPTSCRACTAPTRPSSWSGDRVCAFRDPAGLRPLALGMLGDRYMRRLGVVRVRHHRRQVPARGPARASSSRCASPASARARSSRASASAFCVFEHIYFARPDSRLEGRVVQTSRSRMGEILAREAPVDADLVIAVPDSGNAAARGYARAPAGSRRTTASSRTATSRARSSSPARSCASTACG